MGGAVSTGEDNDDLIDNLVESDYIRTPVVEKVFRMVDRAEYFTPEFRTNAYKDMAWKKGNYHLSAPCIYSEVMEQLCLESGLSFLNLGSGTGYLSTMVGLIVGSRGVNHGIEYHQDVIDYANYKLDNFKRYAGAIDEFDFCEPKFLKGNSLCLSSETRQYDRVYCGAGCPPNYEQYMKNLIKVGGILVVPLNSKLMQIKRTSDNTWESTNVLAVSFSTMIQPPPGNNEVLNMFLLEPTSLQEMCRTSIRNIFLSDINTNQSNLKTTRNVLTSPKRRRVVRRVVVSALDSSDESSVNEDDLMDPRPFNETANGFLDVFLGHIIQQNNERVVIGNVDERNSRWRRRRDSPTSPDSPPPEPTENNKTESSNENLAENGQASNSAEDASNEEEMEGSSKENEKSDDDNERPSKREKFDSGLGGIDDFRSRDLDLEVFGPDDVMDVNSSSSSAFSVHSEHEMTDSDDDYGDDDDNENEEDGFELNCDRAQDNSVSDKTEKQPTQIERIIVTSAYSSVMVNKIQQLPLPIPLKNYLNYFRSL